MGTRLREWTRRFLFLVEPGKGGGGLETPMAISAYTLAGDLLTPLHSVRVTIYIYILGCLLKSRNVKPAETAVARERLCKHRSRGNEGTRNNRGTVGGGVLSAVRAEAL
jgi:hypothetical protein